MEWWKAAALGTLVYVVISLVLSAFAFAFGVLLSLIPLVGILLALILILGLTFAEAVFSGFIAGNLSNKRKERAGFLSGLFGSLIESFVRMFLFTLFAGVVSAGALIYIQIPVEFLVGGGFLGTFLISLVGILSIITACFGGYLGAKVSLELPLRKIEKELRRKVKVPGQ